MMPKNPNLNRGGGRLMAVALAVVLAGCGKDLGQVSLAGENVPKFREAVSVGQIVRVGPMDSQTATYSGTSMDDFQDHVSQLKKVGWIEVSKSETVASKIVILGREKSKATVSWTPAGGIIVNIQVPRTEPANAGPTGTPKP